METDQTRAVLADALEDLSINNKRPDPDIPRPVVQQTKTIHSGKKSKAKNTVVDSWEDDLSSGSDTETEANKDDCLTPDSRTTVTYTTNLTPPNITEVPYVPPPTPLVDTPIQNPLSQKGDHERYESPQGQRNASASPSVRPEKQTAVANRLIAGALGLRAPKRTEEQRAYDRAMKEKEIKRRNRAKEEDARAKEEEERTKAAVWND